MPSTSIVIGVLAMILVFGFYLIVQLKGLFGAPGLEIFSPRIRRLLVWKLQLRGRTDPTASVAINGQKIKKTATGLLAR